MVRGKALIAAFMTIFLLAKPSLGSAQVLALAPPPTVQSAQKSAAIEAFSAAKRTVPSMDGYAYSSILRSEFDTKFRKATSQNRNLAAELTPAQLMSPSIATKYAKRGSLPPAVDASGHVAAVAHLVDNDPRFRSAYAELLLSPNNWIWFGLATSDFQNTVVLTGNDYLCTGVVVGPNTVATAQHCYCKGMQNAQIGNVLDDSKPKYAVTDGVPMKQCGSPVTKAADIAILHVSPSFDPSVVALTLLANDAQIKSAHSVRAVGFGQTESGLLGNKTEVDLPIISQDCEGSVSTVTGSFSDSRYYSCNAGFELVAGSPTTLRDTCVGDSGGPIFVSDLNNHFLLAGLTSREVKSADGSACGNGTIFVRFTPEVMTWLGAHSTVIAQSN